MTDPQGDRRSLQTAAARSRCDFVAQKFAGQTWVLTTAPGLSFITLTPLRYTALRVQTFGCGGKIKTGRRGRRPLQQTILLCCPFGWYVVLSKDMKGWRWTCCFYGAALFLRLEILILWPTYAFFQPDEYKSLFCKKYTY